MSKHFHLLSAVSRLGLLGLFVLTWMAAGSPASPEAYFLTPLGGGIPATDSASAATAIATGYKTSSGNLAWRPGDPPDGALPSITEQLRAEHGFAIGIASTVQFSHATPAGFASHNVSRNNYTEIANEIIRTTRPEVLIGGGHPGYAGTHSYVGGQTTWNDLLAGSTSYTHVVTRTAGVNGNSALLAAAAAVDLNAGQRLMGVFGGSSSSFGYHPVADAPGAPAIQQGSPENPSLAGVVSATLGVLSQDSQGFFALFEQGEIDWSNHENHFAHMIGSVWDLDQAVRAAEAFIDQPGGPQWDDTLLIVTADHANSYLRLERWLGSGDLPRQEKLASSQAGDLNASSWIYPDGEVSYRTTGHTNEPVTLQARGRAAGLFAGYAGAWYPGTRLVDNTQIYTVMRRAVAEQAVRHVILFIGDGMHLAHEAAGSRYLYGVDRGLAWHAWGRRPDGWSGYAATWDVTTYDRYAGHLDQPDYTPPSAPASLGANQARLGYDPAQGGAAPEYLGEMRLVFLPFVPR